MNSSKLVATMKTSWTSEIEQKPNRRTTTFRPSTDLLTTNWRVCTRCRLKTSEEMQYLLQVYSQETIFGEKRNDNSDGSSWSENISSRRSKVLTSNGEIGADWTSEQRNSDKKRQIQMPKTTHCIRWAAKGQCSFEGACAFKHDPNKKGKGKVRSCSLPPKGSPHRNPTGNGKGSDHGSAQGTPTVGDKKYEFCRWTKEVPEACLQQASGPRGSRTCEACKHRIVGSE